MSNSPLSATVDLMAEKTRGVFLAEIRNILAWCGLDSVGWMQDSDSVHSKTYSILVNGAPAGDMVWNDEDIVERLEPKEFLTDADRVLWAAKSVSNALEDVWPKWLIKWFGANTAVTITENDVMCDFVPSA